MEFESTEESPSAGAMSEMLMEQASSGDASLAEGQLEIETVSVITEANAGVEGGIVAAEGLSAGAIAGIVLAGISIVAAAGIITTVAVKYYNQKSPRMSNIPIELSSVAPPVEAVELPAAVSHAPSGGVSIYDPRSASITARAPPIVSV
jgi:hypothetical protein